MTAGYPGEVAFSGRQFFHLSQRKHVAVCERKSGCCLSWVKTVIFRASVWNCCLPSLYPSVNCYRNCNDECPSNANGGVEIHGRIIWNTCINEGRSGKLWKSINSHWWLNFPGKRKTAVETNINGMPGPFNGTNNIKRRAFRHPLFRTNKACACKSHQNLNLCSFYLKQKNPPVVSLRSRETHQTVRATTLISPSYPTAADSSDINNKTIGNRTKDCAGECSTGDRHYLRKSADRKSQIRKAFVQHSELTLHCSPQIFSGSVYHFEQPHAQSFSKFPIVFGINLIRSFNWKNDLGRGGNIFDPLSLVLRSFVAPFGTVGIKSAFFLATKNVNSLRISAPQWWPFEKGETKSANFWQGKV